MWKLDRINNVNNHKLPLDIEVDDITFVCIIKRSETVHSLQDGTYVSAMHIGNEDGYHIYFRLSLLDATAIELKHPSFIDDGLMGRWKLNFPQKGNVPTITLVQAYNMVDFLKEIKSEENVYWIRHFYSDL